MYSPGHRNQAAATWLMDNHLFLYGGYFSSFLNKIWGYKEYMKKNFFNFIFSVLKNIKGKLVTICFIAILT